MCINNQGLREDRPDIARLLMLGTQRKTPLLITGFSIFHSSDLCKMLSNAKYCSASYRFDAPFTTKAAFRILYVSCNYSAVNGMADCQT